MNRLAAVILAGGRGERLGGIDKGQIKVGGVRLIDRVTQALSTQAAVILCAGRDLTQTVLPEGVISITDLPGDFGGPLAGIAAAVDWLQKQDHAPEFLLSVAVDTPFFPGNFAALALSAMSDSTDAAIARYDGQPYPTDGIWRLSSLATLPAQVLAGTAPKGPRFLLQNLTVSYLDWFPQDGPDPFANVNTLEDLLILNRRTEKTPSEE